MVFLPDLDENKLHVLDTDYENYMFLCMENAAAPGQGLACQYLGMCPDGGVLTVVSGRAGGTGATRPEVRGPGSRGLGLVECWHCGWLTRDRHAG